MNLEWDSFVPPPAVWDECLRVLKPGGHLACFAGSRTLDLMTLSVRMAGFEIRDTIAAWLYSSGFAKSLDVAKAIDRTRDDQDAVDAVRSWLDAQRSAAGITLAQINNEFGHAGNGGGSASSWTTNRTSKNLPTVEQWERLRGLIGFNGDLDAEVARLNGRKGQGSDEWNSRPAADYAGRPGVAHSWRDGKGWTGSASRGGTSVRATARSWDGWGTALAPAFEPIILARKPLSGTVAATVLEHGTGGLNIAATRTAHADAADLAGSQAKNPGRDGEVTTSAVYGQDRPQQSVNVAGRWPKNAVLAHHPSCSDDGCVEGCHVRALNEHSGEARSAGLKATTYSNSGGYGGQLGRDVQGPLYDDTGGASRFFPTFRYEAKAPNSERPQVDGVAHPTVKPLALMRWLVRLLTPPGGLVLDCFAGSGSTGQAARAEGMRAVLVEREEKYIPLIRARLDARERTPATAPVDGTGDRPMDLLDLLDEEAS